MNKHILKAPFIARLIIVWMTIVTFLSTAVVPAYSQQVFKLPDPGVRLGLSPAFLPATLKGVKINPDNPFQFDFIVDSGDSELEGEAFKDESKKLIKYFLASLTTPENDLWVNLSPYEKERIIPDSFGLTEMGRDLLAQDYLLKQITASIIYPEEDLGKKFWDKVYKEAYAKYGTTEVPVNTFNKVWVVPDKAVVYEHDQTAFVTETHLKVMLEEDYLALLHNTKDEGRETKDETSNVSRLSSNVIREIVIPALEKEVNEGKNFAQLRQVYHSLILATWYKKKLRDSILAKIYMDKKKVAGVGYVNSVMPAQAGIQADIREQDVVDPRFRGDDKGDDVEGIYQQYLEAFKKGVYNYIKEDYDPATKETIPRKYFSGGLEFNERLEKAILITEDEGVFRKYFGKITTLLFSMAVFLNVVGNDALGDRFNNAQQQAAAQTQQIKSFVLNQEEIVKIISNAAGAGVGKMNRFPQAVSDQAMITDMTDPIKRAAKNRFIGSLEGSDPESDLGTDVEKQGMALLKQKGYWIHGISNDGHGPRKILSALLEERLRPLGREEFRTMKFDEPENLYGVVFTHTNDQIGKESIYGPEYIVIDPDIAKDKLLDKGMAVDGVSHQFRSIPDKYITYYLVSDQRIKDFLFKNVDRAAEEGLITSANAQKLKSRMKNKLVTYEEFIAREKEEPVLSDDDAMLSGLKELSAQNIQALDVQNLNDLSFHLGDAIAKAAALNDSPEDNFVIGSTVLSEPHKLLTLVSPHRLSNQEMSRHSNFRSILEKQISPSVRTIKFTIEFDKVTKNPTSVTLLDGEENVSNPVPSWYVIMIPALFSALNNLYPNSAKDTLIFGSANIRGVIKAMGIDIQQLASPQNSGSLLLGKASEAFKNFAMLADVQWQDDGSALIEVKKTDQTSGGLPVSVDADFMSTRVTPSGGIIIARRNTVSDYPTQNWKAGRSLNREEILMVLAANIGRLAGTSSLTWQGRLKAVDQLIVDRISDGARIHDTSASDGWASMDLANAVKAKGGSVVFSDINAVRIVRAGNNIGIFDGKGNVLDVKTNDSDEAAVRDQLIEVYASGAGIEVSRQLPKEIEDFIESNGSLLSRQEVNVLDLEAEEGGYDVVRNLNLFKDLKHDQQLTALRNMGRMLKKEGGLLIEGWTGKDFLNYVLWEREGDDLVQKKASWMEGKLTDKYPEKISLKDPAMLAVEPLIVDDDAVSVGRDETAKLYQGQLLPVGPQVFAAPVLSRREFLMMGALGAIGLALIGESTSVQGQEVAQAPAFQSLDPFEKHKKAREVVTKEFKRIKDEGKMRNDILNNNYWLEVFRQAGMPEEAFEYTIDDLQPALETAIEPYNKGKGLQVTEFAELALKALEDRTLAPRLERFIQSAWGNFIVAAGNNTNDLAKRSDILRARAAWLHADLGRVAESLVGALKTKDVNSLMNEWVRLNEKVFIPAGYYGFLQPVIKVKEGALFYQAVMYKIAKKEPFFYETGKSFDLFFGRKIDTLNILGSLGHVMMGGGGVFIDLDRVDGDKERIIKDKELRNAMFSGMTDKDIEDYVIDAVRRHETAHKLKDIFNVDYVLKDWFGFSQGLWSLIPQSQKNLIEAEIFAYGVEIATDTRPHLGVDELKKYFKDKGTAEFYAARYWFNSLGGVKPEEWVNGDNDEAVEGLSAKIKDLSKEELAKRIRDLIKQGFPKFDFKKLKPSSEKSDGAMLAESPKEINVNGNSYDQYAAGKQGTAYLRRADQTIIKVFDKLPGVKPEHLNKLLEINRKLNAAKPGVIAEMSDVVDVQSASADFPTKGILMKFEEGTSLKDFLNGPISDETRTALIKEADDILDWIDEQTDGLVDRHEFEDYANFVIRLEKGEFKLVNIDPINMRLLVERFGDGAMLGRIPIDWTASDFGRQFKFEIKQENGQSRFHFNGITLTVWKEGSQNAVFDLGEAVVRAFKYQISKEAFDSIVKRIHRLSPENIVPDELAHGFTEDGQAFIAMRKVQGPSLDSITALNPRKTIQVLQLLDRMFANKVYVISGDFKPANFALDQENNRVLIVDPDHVYIQNQNYDIQGVAKEYSQLYSFFAWNKIDQSGLILDYLQNVAQHGLEKGRSMIEEQKDLAQKTEEVGGIDFNADKINLEVNNDGQEIQFHFDPKEFENMNVDGFIPVIMSVTPVNDLPLFLGLKNDSQSAQQLSMAK